MTWPSQHADFALLDRQQWRTLIDFFDGDGSNRDEACDTLILAAPRSWRDELDDESPPVA